MAHVFCVAAIRPSAASGNRGAWKAAPVPAAARTPVRTETNFRLIKPTNWEVGSVGQHYAVRTKPQGGGRFAWYYLAGQLRCGSSPILRELLLL